MEVAFAGKTWNQKQDGFGHPVFDFC